jgi:hypothetical protein
MTIPLINRARLPRPSILHCSAIYGLATIIGRRRFIVLIRRPNP